MLTVLIFSFFVVVLGATMKEIDMSYVNDISVFHKEIKISTKTEATTVDQEIEIVKRFSVLKTHVCDKCFNMWSSKKSKRCEDHLKGTYIYFVYHYMSLHSIKNMSSFMNPSFSNSSILMKSGIPLAMFISLFGF